MAATAAVAAGFARSASISCADGVTITSYASASSCRITLATSNRSAFAAMDLSGWPSGEVRPLRNWPEM